MALLEVQPTKKVTATVALEESTASRVDQYAAFIQAPADEVVNKALEYVFGKDKEFQSFLASDVANAAPKQLRIKRPSEPDAKQRRGPKPRAVTAAHA